MSAESQGDFPRPHEKISEDKLGRTDNIEPMKDSPSLAYAVSTLGVLTSTIVAATLYIGGLTSASQPIALLFSFPMLMLLAYPSVRFNPVVLEVTGHRCVKPRAWLDIPFAILLRLRRIWIPLSLYLTFVIMFTGPLDQVLVPNLSGPTLVKRGDVPALHFVGIIGWVSLIFTITLFSVFLHYPIGPEYRTSLYGQWVALTSGLLFPEEEARSFLGELFATIWNLIVVLLIVAYLLLVFIVYAFIVFTILLASAGVMIKIAIKTAFPGRPVLLFDPFLSLILFISFYTHLFIGRSSCLRSTGKGELWLFITAEALMALPEYWLLSVTGSLVWKLILDMTGAPS